jgi:hypothetical protein
LRPRKIRLEIVSLRSQCILNASRKLFGTTP